MQQVWLALIASAGPAAAAVIGFFRVERGSRIGRRLREHSRLAKQLPEGSGARVALDELLQFEACELRDREIRRSARKVNPINVVLSILFTVGSAIGIYFLVLWGLVASGSLWAILAWFATVVIGLFLALLVGAAWATIFNPPSENKK